MIFIGIFHFTALLQVVTQISSLLCFQPAYRIICSLNIVDFAKSGSLAHADPHNTAKFTA